MKGLTPMKHLKKLLCLAVALALICCCAFAEAPTTDREGNEIALPAEVSKLISLAPACTQVVMDLGLTDKLIAVDTYSATYWPELAELPQFDMFAPDAEQLAALEPDLILLSSMSAFSGGDALEALRKAGVCLAAIPSSESLAAAQDDVRFIAACLGAQDKGEELVAQMQAVIDQVAEIAATITEKKTVFFEISALPYLYSGGANTYLDELITTCGAVNVLGDQQGWVSVEAESAVALNPDVILTNVNYTDDAVGEILGREGWENVTAVKNKAVYSIDNLASSLPNNHLTDALVAVALAVYPDEFASLVEVEPAA